MDSSKDTERLERVPGNPGDREAFQESKKLNTVDTSFRNSLDIEVPHRPAQLDEIQGRNVIPDEETLTCEAERLSKEIHS